MTDPLRLVLLALGTVVILATVLPFARTPFWWIRALDFPRIQIAVIAALVLAGLGAAAWARGEVGTADRVVGIALAAVLLYQSARMMPYSPLWRVQTKQAAHPNRARSLRLVVSNVLMTNRDGARWLRVVRGADPDVVAAVETDAWWAETAGALKESHPYAVEIPQDDTYGMCLYSRLEIAEHTIEHLVEDEVPSLFLTLCLASGEAVRLVILHPRPPRPDIQQDSTLRDAELVRAAHRVAAFDAPTVVAGDLNDVAWSATTSLFQRIAGLLDPRVGRGLFATFHARHRLLRYPLDHIFHSPHLELVALARLDAVGSDHFPMCVELALCPEAPAEQDAPDATDDARDRAAEVEDETQAFLATETTSEEAERKAADV